MNRRHATGAQALQPVEGHTCLGCRYLQPAPEMMVPEANAHWCTAAPIWPAFGTWWRDTPTKGRCTIPLNAPPFLADHYRKPCPLKEAPE